MGLTVGLAYNLKRQVVEDDEPPDRYAEYDSPRTIEAIAAALESAGHDVCYLEADRDFFERVRARRPDIIFNFAEGLGGEARESHVPAMLEMLGIPYTGSGPLALALALDKPMAKRVWASFGIPVPRGQTIWPGQPPVLRRGLEFPLFVKPALEGSSMGISPASVVHDTRELAEQVRRIHADYRGPALVEEFLPGRELTVGLLGNGNPIRFPITEINFKLVPPEHGPIYSYQFKQEWDADEYYPCPAPLPDAFRERLYRLATAAVRALRVLDIARVDIRCDGAGRPVVLECNPLPGLCPGYSDLPRQAAVGGMAYEELVNGILDAALERYGMIPSARAAGQFA